MKPDFDDLQKRNEMMTIGVILWTAMFLFLGITSLIAYVIIN